MDIAKRLNINNIFIFLLLILFPFGQIIKIGIINPIDLVVGAAFVYSLIKNLKRPKVFKYFFDMLFVFVWSYVFSLYAFWGESIHIGVLYLIRFVSYSYFLVYLYNYVSKNKSNKKLLLNSLVMISVISAIFGWIQYFLFPDIKPFTIFGWDEHLYRIVGTFLDPSFLSLIIVFGIIISPNIFIKVFLTLTLAFTYSRAGYLAFFVAMIFSTFYKKNIKESFALLFLLLTTILFLPRPAGESVKLERTSSVYARLDNYKETINIFSKNSLFGVGFNNLCVARQSYVDIESFSSHSCSGSDSSILFILATTGILGLISFTRLVFYLWQSSGPLFKISSASLFVGSLFSNSLFYVWIIAWMLILLVSEKSFKE